MGTRAGTTRGRRAATAEVAADDPSAQVGVLAVEARDLDEDEPAPAGHVARVLEALAAGSLEAPTRDAAAVEALAVEALAVEAPTREAPTRDAPVPEAPLSDLAPAPLARRTRPTTRPASEDDERLLRQCTARRRLVALMAVLLLPITALALATAGGPTAGMTSADASFMSKQLVVADQRVRAELVRLRELGTARALARTRDAVLTTRSLAVELGGYRGDGVDGMRLALVRERDWLDAVGSTLSNPRSPLRSELLARDADARRALAKLPAPRARRTGGARSLIAYALVREQATLEGTLLTGPR